MESQPEAWLRGQIEGMSPLIAPVLFSFQQAREDLRRCLEGLTTGQIWATPHGFGSLGFHLRHIAGSVDRLMAYLQGAALTPEQMAVLHAEHVPSGAGGEELLALYVRRDSPMLYRLEETGCAWVIPAAIHRSLRPKAGWEPLGRQASALSSRALPGSTRRSSGSVFDSSIRA